MAKCRHNLDSTKKKEKRKTICKFMAAKEREEKAVKEIKGWQKYRKKSTKK